MISSNTVRAGPDFRIEVKMKFPASRGTGLRADSVIMLDNVTTVLNQHIGRRIGSFSDMSAVDAALLVVFGVR